MFPINSPKDLQAEYRARVDTVVRQASRIAAAEQAARRAGRPGAVARRARSVRRVAGGARATTAAGRVADLKRRWAAVVDGSARGAPPRRSHQQGVQAARVAR